MQNKSRNWTDIQLLISSISIAVTLGFWGMFATQENIGASVSGDAALPPAPPDPGVSNPPVDPPALLPGQILYFGGTVPQIQQPTVQAPTQVATTNSQRGGKGGKGGKSGGSGRTGGSHP